MCAFACAHECQCPLDCFEVIVFLALRKCEITKQTYFALIHWCSAVKTLRTIPKSMKRCLLFLSNPSLHPHPTAGLCPAPCSRHVKRVSRSSRFHSSLQNKTGQNTSPSVPSENRTHGPLELGPIRSTLTPLQTSTMFTPMSVAVKPNEGEVSGYREVGDIVTTAAVGQGFIYILMRG